MPRKKTIPLAELQSTAGESMEATAPGDNAVQVPDLPVLPFSSTRTTKRGLTKLQNEKFLKHIEPLLDEFYVALRLGLRRGSPRALDLAAEVVGLAKSKGGINVIQQTNTKVVADASAASISSGTERRSFSSIVRSLEVRDGNPPRPQTIDVEAN